MSQGFLLSGGIGAGKSTAAEVFRGLGAVVLSADEFARAVLAPGSPESAAVIERWPEASSDGRTVDRARLGRIVFSDGTALVELEAITHPATRTALAAEVDRHSGRVVVIEMPIVRDWFPGWSQVVVDASDEERVARAVGRGNVMEESDVRAVMARQPSRSEWLLAADYVIDNSGDLDRLEQQCRRVWRRVTSEA